MSRKTVWLALCVVGGMPLAAPAGPPEGNFELRRYVPDSCCVYLHSVHNPKRAFVEKKWAGVFATAKSLGLPDEVRRIIASTMEGEERAQFEEQWTKAMELGRQVSWGDLVRNETVFAMRMSPLPSFLVLCDGEPGTGKANQAALVQMLEHTASLDECFQLAKGKCCDVNIWSMKVPGAPLGIQVFGLGDTVGFCTDSHLTEEVVALMEKHGKAGSMADCREFRRALASLPPAEDKVKYVNQKALVGGLRTLAELGLSHVVEGEKKDEAFSILRKIVERADVIDYTLRVESTEGRRTSIHSITALQPGSRDKKLVQALAGRKPLSDPLAVVPIDAVGYSATSGVDLDLLYSLVLDILREDLPHGEEVLARWEQVQEEIGFNLQGDLLDWVSGEAISVSLPAGPAAPFGEWVLAIRVKDAALARKKVTAGVNRLRALAMERFSWPVFVRPAPEVHAEEFQSVTCPMFAILGSPVLGVQNQWLVIGSSAAAANKCLDTAAGKLPSIVKSPRFKEEGIVPSGPVAAATFTDLSQVGQGVAAMMFSTAMVAGAIPDEPEARPWKSFMTLISRLGPVFSKIDFLSSASMSTTFDGQAWRTEGVLTYQPPD